MLPARADRKWAILQNNSINDVYVKIDGSTNTLTTANGIKIQLAAAARFHWLPAARILRGILSRQYPEPAQMRSPIRKAMRIKLLAVLLLPLAAIAAIRINSGASIQPIAIGDESSTNGPEAFRRKPRLGKAPSRQMAEPITQPIREPSTTSSASAR